MSSNKNERLNILEKIQALHQIFAKRGISVQAFVHDGRIVNNPLDESHLWIIELEYVFSVRVYGLEARLIQCGTDAKGKVTLTGGFYVWRVQADEEILGLLKGVEEAK
jgi:hypothetical protein